jgi:hypothetical protein
VRYIRRKEPETMDVAFLVSKEGIEQAELRATPRG